MDGHPGRPRAATRSGGTRLLDRRPEFASGSPESASGSPESASGSPESASGKTARHERLRILKGAQPFAVTRPARSSCNAGARQSCPEANGLAALLWTAAARLPLCVVYKEHVARGEDVARGRTSSSLRRPGGEGSLPSTGHMAVQAKAAVSLPQSIEDVPGPTLAQHSDAHPAPRRRPDCLRRGVTALSQPVR